MAFTGVLRWIREWCAAIAGVYCMAVGVGVGVGVGVAASFEGVCMFFLWQSIFFRCWSAK